MKPIKNTVDGKGLGCITSDHSYSPDANQKEIADRGKENDVFMEGMNEERDNQGGKSGGKKEQSTEGPPASLHQLEAPETVGSSQEMGELSKGSLSPASNIYRSRLWLQMTRILI